jgi:hypothetical protein
LTHGVVANDAWKAKIDTALGLFLSDGDVAAFQQALVAACASDGACKVRMNGRLNESPILKELDGTYVASI